MQKRLFGHRIMNAGLCVLLTTALTAQTPQTPAAGRVATLVRQMTLEEKVGQMAQVTIDQLGTTNKETHVFTPDSAKLYDVLVRYKAGSVLNIPSGALPNVEEWNQLIRTIQRFALKNRLAIPVLYGLDDIHGVNFCSGFTSFPQQIGQAATWNTALAEACGRVTAKESRAVNVPWSFSPVFDLGINPQWPRLWETYGEDPLLSGEMGAAFIRGMQQPGNGYPKVEVSLKHFVGYSDPRYGKDRTNAWIPEHYLREYYLPSFAAGVKAGAANVMVNSALINGVPTHMNKHLLTDILKKELGFKGFVVTDWNDIENLRQRDRVAATNKEAVMLCINAGIDMSMIPYNYAEFCNDLVALVKEGKVSMARINDAVTRILSVKEQLGLLNTATMNSKPEWAKDFGSAAHAQQAFNTAAESITLLKNEGQLLPLKAGVKLLVTGPNANSMRSLNGGWSYSWQGERTNTYAAGYNTILEALQNKFGKDQVRYSPGVVYKPNGLYWEDSIADIAAAVKAAAQVDYIVLCIGENSYTETPGNTEDLSLSRHQQALSTALLQTGKKVIVVLNEGRPRIITPIAGAADALLQVYLPGNYGGDALAAILAGEVNPSGKLPYTYPRQVNALIPYIHKPSDEKSKFDDTALLAKEFTPLFPFGYGLSYTSFACNNLRVDRQQLNAGETLTVTVEVKNTGQREGMETVLLFSSDPVASLTPDVKRLRAFRKILLKAGEQQTVTFRLKADDLAFVHTDNRRHLEAGEFVIRVNSLEQHITVNNTRILP